MICFLVDYKKGVIHKDSNPAWNQMGEMGPWLQHWRIQMWHNQPPVMVEGSVEDLLGMAVSEYLGFVGEPTPRLQPFVL